MKNLSFSGKPLVYVCLFLVIIVAVGLARAQNFIQLSHIYGNVPPQQSFHSFLNRDLLSFFRETYGNSVNSIDYRLLCDYPTQSGVALPKYYVWVKVLDGAKTMVEGVARIAAYEKIQFDVVQFFTVQEIKENPELVKSVFPAPLIAEILKLSGVKQ